MGDGFSKEDGIKEENGSPSSSALIKLRDRRIRNQLLRGEGVKNVSEVMTLVFKENDLGRPRYAIYASRRLGGAVSRNRVKRTFREILNRVKSRLRGYDLIMIPRSPVQDMGDLFPKVEKILADAGILTWRQKS